MSRRPIACSWSGGKDSCLALHRASTRGFEPMALLTVFDDDATRSRSHGLRPEVVRAQAFALGLPLHTARASWQTYESRFTEALAALRDEGIGDVAFGDIDLEDHRAWEQRVCAAAGLQAHLPLWQEDRRAVLEELWRTDHRCHVIAVDAARLPRDVLGRELTRGLADELEAHGVDACGENGEFHTVVTDGPLFRRPIRLEFGDVVERGGYLAIDAAVIA